MPRKTLAERFWQAVPHQPPGECWEWQGARNRLGYGTIGRGFAKHDRAHRVSWELNFGPIPEGAHVLHSCDNRRCVNPAHLRLGTHAENMRDKAERGRVVAPRGEACHMAKLTADQAREIRRRRAAGESIVKLGREFGVSKHTVSLIGNNKIWKHV